MHTHFLPPLFSSSPNSRIHGRAIWPLHLLRLAGLFAVFTCGASLQAADYVWDPAALYNSTHPTSPSPWTTEWVNNPDGSKSLQITVDKGPADRAYYQPIAIPKASLGEGTDFTAEITFRVAQSTALPKTFFLFARNSKSNVYDLWQNWVGEPGQTRTIHFPMQLSPVEGGTWTLYSGLQGSGSIIIDKLVVKEGRELTRKEAVENPAPAAALPEGTKVATGFKPVTIDLPVKEPVTTLSTEGLLIPDGDQPVTEEVAIQNNKALQKLFTLAKNTAGAKTIVIPKGIYRFGNRGTLELAGIKDLTVDGQGSEFIFQKIFTGACLTLSDCERVVIKNIFFDWNWSYKPIASLGKVMTVSEDHKTFEIEFPDQTPEQTALTASSPWMGLFPMDPVTLYRTRTVQPGNFYLGKDTKLTAVGNRVTATFQNPVALEVGTSYSIRHLYYDLCVFKVANSSHLTFDHVVIYSMPGMGWIHTGVTHHCQFLSCKIVRREGSRYPLTTAADGIHCGESKGDFILRDCEFTGLGDDAINLHDNSWQGGLVRGANEKQLKFMNCPKHRLRMEPGDVIRFYNPDFSPAGVELTISEAPIYEGKPNAYAQTTIATVTFTEPVPAKLSPLSAVTNTKFGTKNVLIESCRFVRLFGRAILFAGEDATIENNVFRDVHNCPIFIQTDIVDNHWGEGYGSANVVIRNNIFEDANFAGRWEGTIIYIGGRIPWGQTEHALYRDFLLENNKFINPPGPVVAFNFAQNMIARNNTIVQQNAAPNISPYAGMIQALQSSDLFLGGNTWTRNASSFNDGGVIYDPATTKAVAAESNRLENDFKKEKAPDVTANATSSPPAESPR